jgi:hypothetical protein
MMEFEVAGGMANRDGSNFFFHLHDEDILKALSNSHPHIAKLIRGALCKKFVEQFELFMGRKSTAEEAYEMCRRIK